MTKYDAPVSLAVLWQRWEEIGTNEAEIERANACDKTLFAELDAIEKQIIERPAEGPPDLMAKLKLLAHLARNCGWDELFEKLYHSIEDGLEKSWHRNMTKLEPTVLGLMLGSLRDELVKIDGVALCLTGMTEYATPDDGGAPFRYLGGQLGKHCGAAFSALEEIEEGIGP